MKARTVFTAALALGVASAAGADVIYSNLTEQQGGFANEEGAFDDLRIAAGGTLSELKFTMQWSGFGTGTVTDAQFVLLLDDEDLVLEAPPFNGGGTTDDALLFGGALLFLNATPETQVLTVDLSAHNIEVQAGATLWAGVRFSGFNVGQSLYSGFDVGSSDSFVYDATGFAYPMAGQGLGWELSVVPAPATAALLGMAALAGGRRRR